MYLVLFIGIALISWIVQSNLQSKFKKFSRIPTANGMTGREVAEKMLRENGIYDVTVTSTRGLNRLNEVTRPSNSCSIAAVIS
jgi:Zn-dependent membrane protease YugP